MTFLEALYGSHYYEITKKGKDGAAGRLNGNLFLSAFVIISIFLIIAVLFTISNDMSNKINQIFHKLFGYSSGKEIGRLLAIPLIGIIYLIISKTIGSVSNYERITNSFMQYPEEEKQKANMKILKPFFLVLGLFFFLAMVSLFRS